MTTTRLLRDADCCALFGFAGKFAFFDAAEGDDTVLFSVDGEVAAHVCAVACNLGCASLAYEYFASANFLTTKALYAQSLTGVVVDVLARATSFDF